MVGCKWASSDDGNRIAADGCENNCRFSCSEQVPCDDRDPCNGVESCVEHRCRVGEPRAEGAACGDGKLCVRGACVVASCGDGQRQPGEECDDGNVTPDDGCTTACRFSCLSTDPARACAADECAGRPSCDDTTHSCRPGVSHPDGAPCGAGRGYCAAGTCTLPVCGNKRTEPGEKCDDGNADDTDGCTVSCTFTCVADGDCNDANPCTRDVCSANHTCARAADPSTEGQACAVDAVMGLCRAGRCVPAGCGNGVLDLGEECDSGPTSTPPGSGCTASCRFECRQDSDCSDGNACSGTETCVASAGGKRCAAGMALARGALCQESPRRICDAGGSCVLSLCGDGWVDESAGESCEPPSMGACSGVCRQPACGNGIIEDSEQCDDGNQSRLDGCDPTCRYELMFRMIEAIMMPGQAPEWCDRRTNRLGSAMTPAAFAFVNDDNQNSINAAKTNIIVHMLNLDDLTGVADDSAEAGLTSGIPDPARGAWPSDGSNPIDWWFRVDVSALDADGLPRSRIRGLRVRAREWTTEASDVFLPFYVDGVHATLEMLRLKARGRFDAVPPPDVPAPPPKQLAPGLVVVPGTTLNAPGEGVCGNITVRSWASMPAPDSTAPGGPLACLDCPGRSLTYKPCVGNDVTADCNSMLDFLVGGCAIGATCALAVPVMFPTQPDVDSDGNGLTTLRNDAVTHKIPRSQTDGNADAYSSFFRYRMRRVHATNNYMSQ